MCSKEILIFLSLTADPKTYDKMRNSLQERLLFVFFLGVEESVKIILERVQQESVDRTNCKLVLSPSINSAGSRVERLFSLDWTTWCHLFETVLELIGKQSY